MGISEVFQSALASLWSHKVRTLLTLLGMIIGVFAIITSVTAVKVIDVYFQEKMNFLGSATFTVSKEAEFTMHDGRRDRERRNITFDQVERLREGLTMPVVVSVIEDFGHAILEGRPPATRQPMTTPSSFTTARIRSDFLEFFRGKGHEIVPSAPLVPELSWSGSGSGMK